MSFWAVLGIAVGAALVVLVVVNVVRVLRYPRVARVSLVDADQGTTMDTAGAARSVQAADLVLPEQRLEELWTPTNLERLARTYWRFLSRATLYLIRVAYTDRERFVVLVTRPFVLLRFQAPEYEMDERRGIVRWRIERGLLVAKAGRGGDGYLEIDIERREADEDGCAVAHVEVEVANFYPLISSVSKRLYLITQAFIHVLVTHAFLRSLARLDLANSRAGRYADTKISELPDPPPSGVSATTPGEGDEAERAATPSGRR